MKKRFKYALMLTVLAFCCGTVVSCDDDNDNPEPPAVNDPNDPGQDNPDPVHIVYAGTTVTTPVDNPSETFESERGTYEITYDETEKTAVLTITGAHFANGMPPLVMTFGGISWTSSDGTIHLEKDALVPEIMNKPYPQYAISEFKGTETPSETLSLSFICDYSGNPMRVSFSGIPKK